jgi:hypothetical protein
MGAGHGVSPRGVLALVAATLPLAAFFKLSLVLF